MNLITKYKIFENTDINKTIEQINQNDLLNLIKEHLVNDTFFNFFNSFNLPKDIDINLIKGKESFELIVNFNTPKYNYYTTYFSISVSKFKNMDVCEMKLHLKILYNNYPLYIKSIEIDFIKQGDALFNNIKNFFINSNKEIISTPFIGTKEEVDALEDLMNLLMDSNQYKVYVSKDALNKSKELNNIKDALPKELEFIRNIKFVIPYFIDKENSIYLYAKFEHGSELIKIHEQYANKVYKMYKKILNK